MSPKVSELFDLTGQVALVTGGARNLGFDMALALAEAGCDVAICSRSLEQAHASAAKIREATGRKTAPYCCDVRFEGEVEAMIDAALKEFGRIDVLVNNAGNVVSTPEDAPMEKRPLEAWRFTIDVNLTGVFLCSKHAAAKAMMPARRGNIVNIGSTAGLIGKDRRIYRGTGMGGATIDYHAAKGGVVNMTRDMAVYLAGWNIRVNCISPGGFWRGHSDTFTRQYSDQVPLGRMGQDGKDIKGAVVFFASEASAYVTGANLPVDGGLTAW